jgi:hypothetical protein
MTDGDTFESGQPNSTQQMQLEAIRKGAKEFHAILNANLPSGPDKSFVFRTFRTAIMWASVAIMRREDGSLRS